jgi:hypothetical protein
LVTVSPGFSVSITFLRIVSTFPPRLTSMRPTLLSSILDVAPAAPIAGMRLPSPKVMKLMSRSNGSTSQAVPEPPRNSPAPPESSIRL